MNKILLTIMNYGTTNRNYLITCLREYNSFKNYSITAHIFLTSEFDCTEFKNLNIIKHICPESLGESFVHESKPIIYENRNNFDYYIYSEDDILITKENFDSFISIQKYLPFPYVCGFLRYELLENDDYKYLIDNHPTHSCHRHGNCSIKQNYTINNDVYFEPYNIHQACHVLTNDHIKYLSKNHLKYFEKKSNYAGMREGCASDIYVHFGLIKVIPKNEKIKNLLIHHLPNKYVNENRSLYNKNSTPNEIKLINI